MSRFPRAAVAAAAAALLYVTLAATAAANGTSAYWVPTTGASFFAPTSVWNQELSPEAPTDPSSSSLAGMLEQTVNAQEAGKYGPWISTSGYSTPIYTVPEGQATTYVTLETANPYLQSAMASVPLPPEAQPASASDGQLVVWQPSTNTMWEFWKLHKTPGGWAAKWGGVMNDVSASPGMYTPGAYPGARTFWGATGSGLPLVGGLITIQDLEQGHIDHALAIGIPETKTKIWSWPAVRTDGQRVAGTPEGTHFRLNPGLDLAALNLPPLTLMIAQAAQRYGIIVRDTSPTIQFYAEEPTIAASNPYPALFGGKYPWQLLAKFPWSSLEVLQQQIDEEPPWATIVSMPAKLSNESTATFTFTSSKPNSVFACEVDSSPSPSECDSGTFTTHGLADGWHLFQVRAIDGDGVLQPWPHQYWWRVDTDHPVTTFESTPAGITNQTSAQFTFSAKDETTSEFQCQIDGGGWTSCQSGVNYSELVPGSHTFQVQATDAAGNREVTPLGYTWTIDTTPPSSSIVSEPPSVTASTTATFMLRSSKSPASIRCSLDSGAWTTCVSTSQCELMGSELGSCSGVVEYSSLANGTHTLSVQAVDAAGNVDPSSPSYTWTVDTVPPVSTIVERPAAVSGSSSATLGFSAQDATPSTFQCQIDAGAWFNCVSPLTLSSLSDGEHTFAVKATDAAGNVELTPPSVSWIVDTDPPVTTITEAPPPATNSSTASFAFSAKDTTSSTFECQLDNGEWSPCTSPAIYAGLGEGPHTLDVRATDAAGNVERSPASASWTVEPIPPSTTITSAPKAGVSRTPNVSFGFAANRARARFQCELDRVAWSACTSPASYSGLSPGAHVFTVRATDQAGDADPSPPNQSFEVTIPTMFSPTSYINEPLEQTAPVAGESSELVAELEQQVNGEVAGHSGPTIVTNNTTTDVYEASPTTSPVKVGGLPKTVPSALQQALSTVPIPTNARPTYGRASQITIWQPSSDRLWELRGVWRYNGGWYAAWGGEIEGVTTNPGYFGSPSWGATGSGIPLVAGMITASELQRGRIEHALALQIPAARASQWSWPAQRSDGTLTGSSAIPEGTRFRLDPSLNIASLSLPPVVAILAQAAQRYGIVIRGTAPQVSFYAEEPTGASPYPSIFGSTPLWQQLASFPWSHLQALPLSLSP